jgi:hypothetical protein
MTAALSSKNGKLYVGDREVLRGWESFSGWFWFALEKVGAQDSELSDGFTVKGDTIWFGYVQGLEEEYGDFSQAELEQLAARGQVWEIPAKDLPNAGRRAGVKQ